MRTQSRRSSGWFATHPTIAERVAGEVLSLPIGPHLSAAEVRRVVEVLALSVDGRLAA